MSEIFSNPSSEANFETFTETFQSSSDIQMSTNTYSNEESNTVEDQTRTAIAEVVSSTVYSAQSVATFSERYKKNRSKFKGDLKFICDPCPRKSALSATSSPRETETSEFHSVKSTQEEDHASTSSPTEIYTVATNSQSKFEDFTAEAATESEKRKFSSVTFKEETNSQQEDITVLTSNESSGITGTEQESSMFSNTFTALISSNNNQEISSEEESVSYDVTEQTNKLLPTADEEETLLQNESESSISATENYGPITKSPDQDTSLEKETISSTTKFETSTGMFSNHDQMVNPEKKSTVINESVLKNIYASETGTSVSDQVNLSSMSSNQGTISQEENTTFMNNEAEESTESVFTNRENSKSPSDHNAEITSSMIQAISDSTNIMTVLRSLTTDEQNKPNYEVPTLEYFTKSTEINVAAKKEQDRQHKMSQEKYKIDYQKYICDPCPRANRYLKQFRHHTVKDEYFSTPFESSTHTQLIQGTLAKISDTFTHQPTIIRNKFTDYQQGITREVLHNPDEDIDNRLETQLATEFGESDTSSTFKELKNMQEQSESELNAFTETLKLKQETNKGDVFSELPSQVSNEESTENEGFEVDQGTAIMSPLQPLFASNELPTRMLQITTKETDESEASHRSDNIPLFEYSQASLITEAEEMYRKGVKKTSQQLNDNSQETSSNTEMVSDLERTREVENEDQRLHKAESLFEVTTNHEFDMNRTESISETDFTLKHNEAEKNQANKQNHISATSHSNGFSTSTFENISETSMVSENVGFSATNAPSELISLANGRSFQTEFNEEQFDTVTDTGVITDVKSTYGHYFATGALGKEEMGQIVEGGNLSLTMQMPIEADTLSTSTTRKSIYQKGAPPSSIKSEDEFSISSEVPVHYVYIFAENCTQPKTTSFEKEDKFAHTRHFTSRTVTEPQNFGAGTGVSLKKTSGKTEQSKAAEDRENAVTYEITSETPTEHTKASKTATQKMSITETALQPSEESESGTTENISNTISAEELEEEYSKQDYNLKKTSTAQEMGNESAAASLNESEYKTSEFITSKSKTQNIALSTSEIKTDHFLRSTTELVTTQNVHSLLTTNELGQGASSTALEGSTGSEVSSTENISDYSELSTNESTENANVSGASSQEIEKIESSTTEITGNMSSHKEVSNETISSKSESEETENGESSHHITEQTEPGGNGTSEPNENLSSSEHFVNQTESDSLGHFLRSTTELVTTQMYVHRKHTKTSEEIATVVSTTEIDNNLVGMETTPCKYCIEEVSNPHSEPIQYYFSSTPTAPQITALNTETQYETLSQKMELEETSNSQTHHRQVTTKLYSTGNLATSEHTDNEKEGQTEYETETVSVSQKVDEEKELVSVTEREEATTPEQVTEVEDNKADKEISSGEFYKYSKNTPHIPSSAHHKETNKSTAEGYSETKIDEERTQSGPQLVEETPNVSTSEGSTSEEETLSSLYNNKYRTSLPIDDNKYETSEINQSSNSYFSKSNTERASSTESEATKQEINENDSEESTSAKEAQQFITGNVTESTETFDSITTERLRGETGAVSAEEEEAFSADTSEENNTGSSKLTSFPSKGLTNETATESEENFETTSEGNGSKRPTIAPQSAQMSGAERSSKPASEINAESEQINTNSLNAQETGSIKYNKPYNQTMQESETERMANSEEESTTRLQTDQILTFPPVSTLEVNHMDHGKSSPLTMGGGHDKNTTENAEETVEATSENVEKAEASSQSEISDTTSLSNDEETSGGSEATEVSALGDAKNGENTGSLEATTSEEDNATKLTSNGNENVTNTEASGESKNVGPENETSQEFTQQLSSENSTGSEPEEITKNSLESSETTEEKHVESSLDASKSEEGSSTEIKELTTNELGQGASSTALEGSTGSEVSSTENISDYSELSTNESTENANVSGASSQEIEKIESSTTETTGNVSSHEEVSNETGLTENSASESNTGPDNKELSSSENISSKSESEETKNGESSHHITEQTEPGGNGTSEPNENLSSSEHFVNQTEPSESSSTESTGNLLSSEPENPSEGTENETISEGKEKPSSTELLTEIGSDNGGATESSKHLSSSITTETESVESDTSEGTGSGLNETEPAESFNSGASGMSSEVSEGTTPLEEQKNASPLNNSIESEVTGEGKENTSGVHNEEHSTSPVEEEGTQSSSEESGTYTKGTIEISTGTFSEYESQSFKSSEITEKILAENTESINPPEQTGPEASSTEENALNTATELTHMLIQTTTEVESFHSVFGSSVATGRGENELEGTTSSEENASRHEGSLHGYSSLATDLEKGRLSTTEMNTASSTHHHLKHTKKREETLLTTIEIESGLVAMETTPCEYCAQSTSDHHSTVSTEETKPHLISVSTATKEQSEKEVFEDRSETENEIEETSTLEHDLHSKTTLHHSTTKFTSATPEMYTEEMENEEVTKLHSHSTMEKFETEEESTHVSKTSLHHSTSKFTSATPEMYTEEQENEEVTKLHSHSTMEKLETEEESTHASKTTKHPTFSTTEETEPKEEKEVQTTVSIVHTTEEPTTKQAAITENEIEKYTENIQESTQSSTEHVSHKPVVYVINNSKGKYKKMNEFMIEQIISTGVPNVELHFIDLNDEEVPKSLETLHNRSSNIDIPHQICSKADFDSENNCFCNINTYLDTLENRISKKEEIKSKYSYCKSFFKLTKGLIIENSIEPIRRKRRGLIYLDDKKKKSDTLNFDSIEGMFDQSFKLPISGANMFYLPTETVNILCSNSSAEHHKDVSWTWSFYPISSPNAQLLPERGPELVIHEGLLKQSGNYTCKHEKTRHLPAAEHWHELEMLTFPIYQIILNIYYQINDSCSLQIGDTLYAYLPKIISPLLCTKDGEVCSLDIDRPRCLTREDDNYFNVTINVKTISDFVLRFSTTCDINCKLSVYENVVNMVYKNSEMIVKLPVLSKLDQLHKIDFIPHLNGKVGSPVTIKAPKVIVYCAAGFGLESEKQRVCVVCPPQTFSPDNAAFCTSCPGGQYQPEAGSKTCIQCNSPVDDKLCLRMLYTNTKLFKIYVGVAFAVIFLMIIIIIVWTSGFKDDSHVDNRYKGSLRHRAASNRKDVDLETGVNAPLLGRSPNRTAPQLPPLDF